MTEREKYEIVMDSLRAKLPPRRMQLSNREDGYREGILAAMSKVRAIYKPAKDPCKNMVELPRWQVQGLLKVIETMLVTMEDTGLDTDGELTELDGLCSEHGGFVGFYQSMREV